MKSVVASEKTQQNRVLGAMGIGLTALIWLGMVLGVSFLATSTKFMAPTLSLPTALDVGRHTFQTFMRVELVFCVAVAMLAFAFARTRLTCVMATVLVTVVLYEKFWLLPLLDDRVNIIFTGGMPAASSLHEIYIALEAVKAVLLLALGVWALLEIADTHTKQ